MNHIEAWIRDLGSFEEDSRKNAYNCLFKNSVICMDSILNGFKNINPRIRHGCLYLLFKLNHSDIFTILKDALSDQNCSVKNLAEELSLSLLFNLNKQNNSNIKIKRINEYKNSEIINILNKSIKHQDKKVKDLAYKFTEIKLLELPDDEINKINSKSEKNYQYIINKINQKELKKQKKNQTRNYK
jgi:hypothetical protein